MPKVKFFISQHYFGIFAYSLTFIPAFFWNYFTSSDLVFSDSPAYLDRNLLVPPFYYYLLEIFQLIFGRDNYQYIIVTQFLIFFHLLFFAVAKLAKTLNIKKEVWLAFVLAICWFYLRYTSIQTEVVAYPLFFLVIHSAISLIRTKNFKDYLFLMILTVILCLVRLQFIILFPIIFIILFAPKFKVYTKSWSITATLAILIIGFAGSLASTPIANYFTYGKFVGPQLSGLQIIITPSYLVTQENKNLFDSEMTRNIFLTALPEMQKMNAVKYCNKSKWAAPEKKEYEDLTKSFPNWLPNFFYRAFKYEQENYKSEFSDKYKFADTKECIMIPDNRQFVNASGERDKAFLLAFQKHGINDWLVINQIVTEIAVKLIINDPTDWIKFSLLTSYINFGMFYMAIIYLILIFYLYKTAKNKNELTNLDYYIMLGLLTHLANTLFISFTSMVHFRYMIYTYVMIFSSLYILISTKLISLFPHKNSA